MNLKSNIMRNKQILLKWPSSLKRARQSRADKVNPKSKTMKDINGGCHHDNRIP